ncbi:MAG: hypothetical protein ABSG98_01065 [Anaerolineales bacterium]
MSLAKWVAARTGHAPDLSSVFRKCSDAPTGAREAADSPGASRPLRPDRLVVGLHLSSLRPGHAGRMAKDLVRLGVIFGLTVYNGG